MGFTRKRKKNIIKTKKKNKKANFVLERLFSLFVFFNLQREEMLKKEKGRSFGQKSSFCSVLSIIIVFFLGLKQKKFTSCFCLLQVWKLFQNLLLFNIVRSRGTDSLFMILH